ncbi:MAG: hypothetical protein WD490_05325 [Opitutales bacterium]
MHHEPFDEQSFIDVLSRKAPQIMQGLRSAISGLHFFIPKTIQMEPDGAKVQGEDITGNDGFFRIRTFRVPAPLERFESGAMIVFDEKQNVAIKLGELLSSKLKTKSVRDFGIFDRMKGDRPEYTFLRE